LHRVADARNCSVNQLVNSGLSAHYSKVHSGRFGVSSRPTQPAASASYDKMTPSERQQLVEALAGLAGLQEGPKDRLIDGTRYEYDCKVKRTGSCAGMDVFAEGCVEGSGSGSGSRVEKGIRGVGEGRGGTGKTKAATTAGEKLALRATAKI